MIFSLNGGAESCMPRNHCLFPNIIYSQLRLHLKGTYPRSPPWNFWLKWTIESLIWQLKELAEGKKCLLSAETFVILRYSMFPWESRCAMYWLDWTRSAGPLVKFRVTVLTSILSCNWLTYSKCRQNCPDLS